MFSLCNRESHFRRKYIGKKFWEVTDQTDHFCESLEKKAEKLSGDFLDIPGDKERKKNNGKEEIE